MPNQSTKTLSIQELVFRMSPEDMLLRSGSNINEITFGAASIGNLYRQVSDEDAFATLQAAWELGVRRFDVAPHYGLGLAEIRLGKFLADKPRGSFCLSTKVGRLLRPNSNFSSGLDLKNGFAVPDRFVRIPDFSLDGVKSSLEDSLNRLGMDHVDILYLHDPDEYDLENDLENGLEALIQLRDQGTVREIGIGSKSVKAHVLAVSKFPVDVIMLAGRYTLLDQSSAESLLPLCAEKRIDVVNVGIFNSGILAKNSPPTNATFDYAVASLEVVERARRIGRICQAHGVDLPTAAIHFAISTSVVRSIAIAGSSPQRITDSLNRVNYFVPQQLWKDLEAEEVFQA